MAAAGAAVGRCVALNCTSVWNGSTAAAERMEWGSIVNVSSVGSYVPLPLSGHCALASDAARWVTGQTLTVSGGLTSF